MITPVDESVHMLTGYVLSYLYIGYVLIWAHYYRKRL
jgi:hypothetical protein